MKKYIVILPNREKIELIADGFVEQDNRLNIYFYIEDDTVCVVPIGSAIIEIFD